MDFKSIFSANFIIELDNNPQLSTVFDLLAEWGPACKI